MIRLKREQYAVGEAERDGVTITVGIFYNVPITDDVGDLAREAQHFGRIALEVWGGNHEGASRSVEVMLDQEYPGRPFYVETREDGRGVQVYQPYGMPQESSGTFTTMSIDENAGPITLNIEPCDEHGYNCHDHTSASLLS